MNLRDTIRNIKNLKIQGATNVAISAIRAFKDVAKRSRARTSKNLLKELNKAMTMLFMARPTEPLMRNALRYIRFSVKLMKDVKMIRRTVNLSSRQFTKIIDQGLEDIGKIGAKRIRDGMTIMTHCHSSTVLSIFKTAKKQGKRFKVIFTESRPLYQGRLMAKDLLKLKIPATMIVDSAVSTFLHDSDMVLVGCDLITNLGDCINKIGTRNVSLGAKRVDIPLFVCTSLLKFDPETVFGELEDIEQRSPKEIWKNAPKRLNIKNPAFDVTPRGLVKGYITESGIVTPGSVYSSVRRKYPWVFQ